MIPPCSNWKLWIGKEVEGRDHVGETTLFIRDLGNINFAEALQLAEKSAGEPITRVWFCKEFLEYWQKIRYKVIRQALENSMIVCLEVPISGLGSIPEDVFEKVKIYYKIEAVLKEGDHICIGHPFSDESFPIGSGFNVIPEEYLNDQQIR